LRVDRGMVDAFAGSFLSEPKPDVFFTAPAAPVTRAAFTRAIRARGVALDRRAQLLYDTRSFYINGQQLRAPREARRGLAALADSRALTAPQCAALNAAAVAQFYLWYRDGYIDTTT
ncbi:MAG: winged helix domain-containing protein, partial [Casimicrobiaceae bacterium]